MMCNEILKKLSKWDSCVPQNLDHILSNWENRALVNSNVHLAVGSFDLRFQF